MPSSLIVSVLAFLSAVIDTLPSNMSAELPEASTAIFRLLMASEAFEISSRRKISFCE